jgi:DNA-directed RNA polymerase subunit RPC12/RpoP
MPTVVKCGECSTVLAEPSDTPLENRVPCPKCGSKVRSFAVGLEASIVATSDITGRVTRSAAINATTEITATPAEVTETLEDAGFDVQWLRLSEGGPWMVRVFDRAGKFIDGSIADNPEDAILAVSEKLVPPSEPTE